MAEKEKKDDSQKSEKRFQFNLKKMIFPLVGLVTTIVTILATVFIAGRFVGIGPFAPPLSLEEQIAEAEALEEIGDGANTEEDMEECDQLNKTKKDL